MNPTSDTITFDHPDPERYSPVRLTGTVVRTAWHGAIYVSVPGYGDLLTWPDRIVQSVLAASL